MATDINTQPRVSRHDEHSRRYTEILDNFIKDMKDSNSAKQCMKKVFFWIIMIIMLILAVSFAYAIYSSFCTISQLGSMGNGSTEAVTGAVTAVLSSFGALLTSLIKLPEIIAKYLFNPKEGSDMVTIIGRIQKHDAAVLSIERDIRQAMMEQGAAVPHAGSGFGNRSHGNGAQNAAN